MRGNTKRWITRRFQTDLDYHAGSYGGVLEQEVGEKEEQLARAV